MTVAIRLKYLLYDHYWWLLAVTVVVAFALLSYRGEPTLTVATVVGSIISVAYFIQKQKLEELAAFREIFRECNARYDSMNDELARIAQVEPTNLSCEDRAKIVDYLNLCGEEFLYYRRGYVDPSVWEAWKAGMQYWMGFRSISGVWAVERKTGSYYNLPIQ